MPAAAASSACLRPIISRRSRMRLPVSWARRADGGKRRHWFTPVCGGARLTWIIQPNECLSSEPERGFRRHRMIVRMPAHVPATTRDPEFIIP